MILKQTGRASDDKTLPGAADSKKNKKTYAVPCMIAILIVALAMFTAGHVLRATLLEGLPQYDSAPDIAIPMMLLHDREPLHEARERAAWEAEQLSAQASDQAAQDDVQPGEQTDGQQAGQDDAQPVEQDEGQQDGQIDGQQTEQVDVQQPENDTDVSADELPGADVGQPDGTADATEAADTQTGDDPAGESVSEAPEGGVNDSAAVFYPVDSAADGLFDNTLFIGDSKTEGMKKWARIGNARYFCGVNYSVYNVFEKTASDEAFTNAKLADVLADKTYDRIYIILGYNEAGYPYEGLMKQFRYVIGRVREAQPGAQIILHGVMHASKKVADRYDYYSPEALERVNEGLKAIAGEQGLTYMDSNPLFCDENGYLRGETSSDGEHLTPEYTKQWADEFRRQAG